MSIKIESAKADDIETLVGLLNILFSIEQDFSPNEMAQRNGLRQLLERPEQAQIFVARHPEVGVVGMVSAQLVISSAMGAPSAWIEDMVIHDQFRNQGLGKKLLSQATNWAKTKGAKRVQLIADADNEKALGFYKHLDWKPTRLFAWNKLIS
jgi:GNAT superfamily N-acetyltransferase